MEMLLRTIIACALLFPWSFVIGLAVAAFMRSRRHHEYIPPSNCEPILLDSAQVSKALRERA